MVARLTKEDVLALLERSVMEEGVNAYARRHGLSPAYVSSVLSGTRTLGPKVLKAMALKKVTLYEKAK